MDTTTGYVEGGLGWKIAKSEADVKEALLHGFCEAEKSIGDAECAILDKVGSAECDINKNVNDVAHRSTIHLNAVERDLQNRIHENRSFLSDRITQFERNADMQFRDVLLNQEKIAGAAKLEAERNTRIITDRMDAVERRSLKDELDETRMKLSENKYHSALALQNQEISSLKQMLNSVEQTQKFVSKTTQFGTGNLAGTAQTANQG